MNVRLTPILVALLALTAVSAAQAQPVIYQPQGAGGHVLLEPADAGFVAGPVFLSGAETGPINARSGGNAGGHGVSSLGIVEIGFDYLRPFWTFRDFNLAVPASRSQNFPLFGDTGSVDNHFAFAPRVNYNYNFADLHFGIAASGSFLNLSGRLNRQVVSVNGGIGLLTANSSLTLIGANLVEVTRRVDLGEWMVEKKGRSESFWDGVLLDLSLGTRYSSIDQSYTGSLVSSTGATNLATRYSSQSFQGIGLTGMANLLYPVTDDLVLFSKTRASVLVGNNQKESTITVIASGVPALGDVISDSRTAFIPVLELELGGEWGLDLAEHLRSWSAETLLTVRVALVGQFWGDVGPLSAGSPQGFRRSDLFLFGANVMVGLHR